MVNLKHSQVSIWRSLHDPFLGGAAAGTFFEGVRTEYVWPNSKVAIGRQTLAHFSHICPSPRRQQRLI